MNARRMLFRLSLVLGSGILIPSSSTIAQTTPPKEVQPAAPGLRQLTGEDARRAEELEKAIEVALKADRWDEAIARAEELLALRTRAQGPKHFETTDAEWQLRALRRVATRYAEDRRDFQSAKTMNEQAESLLAKGQYAAAQPVFEKALAIRHRLLTDEHPWTAAIRNNLAADLLYQGKYRASQTDFEEALAVCRKLLGEDHPLTAEIYNNLATNLGAQGKYAEAQPLFEKALTIFRRIHPDDHPSVAIAYGNLAQILESQGTCITSRSSTVASWSARSSDLGS